MIAKVITLINTPQSVKVAKRCVESGAANGVNVEYFKAITPKNVDQLVYDHEIDTRFFREKWSRYINALSAFMSHYSLWLECFHRQEDYLILEHDAVFTRKFEEFQWEGGVLGLNDPRRATHSSLIYHNLASLREGVHSAPWVSSYTAMPQGLAGNSAYIIKPKFADMLLMKLKEKGGWPNDAIMCKQFFPMQLKVVYPYYTTIQGIKSTTTS